MVKEQMRKIFASIFTYICIVFCLILVIPITIHAQSLDFQAKIEVLKQKFPDGKYWNHVGMTKDNSDGYTDKPCALHAYKDGRHINGTNGCTCNHYMDLVEMSHNQSSQCMGFANKLGYDVFGPTKWTKNTTNAILNIKVGDIVRISGHSSFVIGKTGNTIIVAECNNTSLDNGCLITWGRTIDLTAVVVTNYEHADNYDAVIDETMLGSSEESVSENQPVQSTFTGWKELPDMNQHVYYKKGVLQTSKWLTISKKKYYVDDKGYPVTGLYDIDNVTYYFDNDGVLQKKQWITDSGKNYYVNENGYVLKSQWLYKGNLLVYVKKSGAVAKSEIVKIGKKQYFFNSKYKRSKGFHKYKGKYYYTNASGVVQKKKWLTVKSHKYYLQKNGVRATNQLLNIGSYQYYFNEKGYMLKNKKFTYAEKIYKADKKGHCKFVKEVPPVEVEDLSPEVVEPTYEQSSNN